MQGIRLCGKKDYDFLEKFVGTKTRCQIIQQCSNYLKIAKTNPNKKGTAEIKCILSPRKGEWAKSDRDRLLEGLKLFGKDYDRLTKYVGAKSKAQVYTQVVKIRKHF